MTLWGTWVQMSPSENSEEAEGRHAERENDICVGDLLARDARELFW